VERHRANHLGMTTETAIREMSARYPDLARARNAALSIPVTTSVPMAFDNAPATAPVGQATKRFDALVDVIRASSPGMLYATAIQHAARQNPTLAMERN